MLLTSLLHGWLEVNILKNALAHDPHIIVIAKLQLQRRAQRCQFVFRKLTIFSFLYSGAHYLVSSHGVVDLLYFHLLQLLTELFIKPRNSHYVFERAV